MKGLLLFLLCLIDVQLHCGLAGLIPHGHHFPFQLVHAFQEIFFAVKAEIGVRKRPLINHRSELDAVLALGEEDEPRLRGSVFINVL